MNSLPRISGAFFIPGRGANLFAKADTWKMPGRDSAGTYFVLAPPPLDQGEVKSANGKSF